MSITLTPDQQAWLREHVERGNFASIEDAVRQLIDERIAEIAAGESDDLAWAKPHVDQALAEAARGDVMTLEEHEARNDARLAAMKR
jgi:antitoxin ParD1/3/4